MARFPPGKGGGEGDARGGTGTGVLSPSRPEGNGMPWAHRTTPAKGDERAQGVPRLDGLTVHTGKRGRPGKRLKGLAPDTGYDDLLCEQLPTKSRPFIDLLLGWSLSCA